MYNPQNAYGSIQGSSPYLQGSSLLLQGSSPGLQVQAPYQPNFLGTGGGGTTISSGGGGGGTTGGGGGGNTSLNTAATGPSYTVGVNDPATLALYQQQIAQYNQALNSLPTQLQGTENQNQANYQTAAQTLAGQLNQANNTYGTNTTQNKQSFVTNKNTIGTNAGQSLTGLERLLGSRGAGGSSAALFSAPLAVAQQATQQRAGAGQAYGDTQNNLDTSFGNYKIQNQNDVNSIQNQLAQANAEAQRQEQGSIAGLNQQLATLQAQYAAAQGGNAAGAASPYLASAQNALNAANSLGLKAFTPTYNANPYSAPAATSYATNPFATPQSANPGAGIINNSVTPAFANLLKQPATSLSGVTNVAAPVTAGA